MPRIARTKEISAFLFCNDFWAEKRYGNISAPNVNMGLTGCAAYSMYVVVFSDTWEAHVPRSV